MCIAETFFTTACYWHHESSESRSSQNTSSREYHITLLVCSSLLLSTAITCKSSTQKIRSVASCKAGVVVVVRAAFPCSKSKRVRVCTHHGDHEAAEAASSVASVSRPHALNSAASSQRPREQAAVSGRQQAVERQHLDICISSPSY